MKRPTRRVKVEVAITTLEEVRHKLCETAREFPLQRPWCEGALAAIEWVIAGGDGSDPPLPWGHE